jgi:hypothetical protein
VLETIGIFLLLVLVSGGILTVAPILALPMVLLALLVFAGGMLAVIGSEPPPPAPAPRQLQLRDVYARILIPIVLLIILGKLTGYDITALLPGGR